MKLNTDGLLRSMMNSFLKGAASILDLGGTLSPTLEDYRLRGMLLSDEEAIRSDWEAVGNDFQTVMGKERHP